MTNNKIPQEIEEKILDKIFNKYSWNISGKGKPQGIVGHNIDLKKAISLTWEECSKQIKEVQEKLKNGIKSLSVEEGVDYYDNCNYRDFEELIDKVFSEVFGENYSQELKALRETKNVVSPDKNPSSVRAINNIVNTEKVTTSADFSNSDVCECGYTRKEHYYENRDGTFTCIQFKLKKKEVKEEYNKTFCGDGK